ncbi:lamin tail domain-containing protein [Candidatus Peregrinibacteria bacterium]|nr:lamin tail domain-containing protein [Candidatus Peregrinibacteria bacterium]
MNVVISEVYPVPLPAEGEWVELWNGAEKPVDLSGWKLDDAEGGGSRAWEFPEGFLIQPGAFILLRSDQTHLALNNEGDSVALIAPDGAVVDRITYGKLRRGGALARVIQRIGDTGEFRTTDRFCVSTTLISMPSTRCRGRVTRAIDRYLQKSAALSVSRAASGTAISFPPMLRVGALLQPILCSRHSSSAWAVLSRAGRLCGGRRK